ncbi:hypothetical protein JG687_00019257 [Phytophthora cactorum]|uniref:Uncharacterized protein n=1 Tax=Phytophthora cactorum TaxID=29920 RepID=A0A8T1TJF4_9STRA|nr:hypothetical protein JG687_00019257 [Phytophthora cactorum]
MLQIQALLTQDEVTRAHSSTDVAGLLFEQIKSRLPFSSKSTKGRGRSNMHLTPIDRLPFQALKSRSANVRHFLLHLCMEWFLLDFCVPAIFAWREFAALRFSYKTTVLHDVFRSKVSLVGLLYMVCTGKY